MLVTCGRGFGAHVVKEISSKIQSATNVCEQHEGKVFFDVPREGLWVAVCQLKMVERVMLRMFYCPMTDLSRLTDTICGE